MNNIPVTTETPETAQSPNDLLASQITEALVTAGLIKDMHKGQLLAKLKTGSVRQEDWSLWIDLATAQQAKLGESIHE